MISRMTTPGPNAAVGSVGTVDTQFLDLPTPVTLECGRALSPTETWMGRSLAWAAAPSRANTAAANAVPKMAFDCGNIRPLSRLLGAIFPTKLLYCR